IVRTFVVGFGLVVLMAGAAAPAGGQWLGTDARRIGMGGLSLGRSGSLVRYNPAYRAVSTKAERRGQPKVTIPIPLGIIQFLHDHPHLSSDPAFDPKSRGFNPILVVNTILNLPLYLEVKKAPTPTNDIAFVIGKDELMVNLGRAASLVPEDQFGIGGANPVTPDGRTLTQYSKPGNTLGHGIGADIGVAWVSGPIELGVGVNDIGATITWPDTRLDSAFYSDSGYSVFVASHRETKTK